MDIQISPSVLASDLADLAKEAVLMEKAGADMLHLDIMDGIFVPNITFGPPVIRCLRKKTNIHFDAHLMIENPIDYIKAFAEAGADGITFHYESKSPINDTIAFIHQQNLKAGLSLKPKTPVKSILPYIKDLDLILIMTVEPGFGGQKYIGEMEEKIKELKQYIVLNKLKTSIQVDGGIDDRTISGAALAGADNFVSGSYLFQFDDYKTGINRLREEGEKGAKQWQKQ